MVHSNEQLSPEGGWGYVVAVAVFTCHFTTVVPLSSFGLLHGTFLSTVGNETTGTATSVMVYLAFLNFTGLLTGYLLGKYSYRTVGLIGSSFHLLGSVLIIFAGSLIQFILCFGVLQGLATGILIPTAVSSLNDYFCKKMNLVTGIVQIFITVGTIIFPPLIAYCMGAIGYTNTKIVVTLLSSVNFLAVLTLRPVNRLVEYLEVSKINKCENLVKTSDKPLLKQGQSKCNEETNSQDKKTFSLSLLKSPKYLSIAFGVAVAFQCDNMFTASTGLVFHRLQFSAVEIATVSMIYFGTDLLARVFYCIVSAFYNFRNRYVFYVAVMFTVLFRIVFVFRDDYIWRAAILAIMGFLRCFIQTPYFLIFAEEYRDNFPTAFSLSIIIGGFVGLSVGGLINAVKQFTDNADLIMQVLTVAMLITTLIWTIEFAYKIFNRKKQRKSEIC